MLGRSCQIFRSAAPLRAGPLPALRSQSTYVDTCIDSAGIVLRETQVGGGHTLSDRRAVPVQTGSAAVADASFDLTGPATPFDSGGGAFTPLTLTSRPPGGSWALAHPPAGFQHLGRFAAVPPQPQLFGKAVTATGRWDCPVGSSARWTTSSSAARTVSCCNRAPRSTARLSRHRRTAIGVDLDPLGAGQLLLAGNGVDRRRRTGQPQGVRAAVRNAVAGRAHRMMRGLAKEPGGTLTGSPGLLG